MNFDIRVEAPARAAESWRLFVDVGRSTTGTCSQPRRALRMLVLAVCGMAMAQPLYAQTPPFVPDTADYRAGDFRVFTGAGEPSSIEAVVAAMGDHEVVFIGETHDDPTGHALELALLQGAHEAYGVDNEDGAARPVVASLEFFQRDVQPILDEYLGGLITERTFRAASRPWPRYETDYRPIVEYAKEHDLTVVAANAPARYANRASRLGRASLEGLSAEARSSLAPLPYGQASRAYLDQWVMVMMSVMEQERMKCGVPIPEVTEGQEGGAAAHQATSPHGGAGNQFDGQVLWDATMAYWISDQLARQPDALVLHMVGSFHVARGTGTPEQLVRYRPSASHMIVMMRPVDDVDAFDPAPAGEWGDFVIQTDASRTLEAIECRADG